MDSRAHQRYLEELKSFLRIPSVSTDPERRADVRSAAEFVACAASGRRDFLASSSSRRRARNPLVYGEWLGAPGKPVLLMYGHYDVQPPEPLDEWKSPPFEPEVRGDNIYARGAADDKGLTLILIKAVERLMQRDGKLPVNVRFLIEGEEEIGGEHIEHFVQSGDPRLQADAALICDTEMFAPELPTICVGLRGIVYGELHVQGAEGDLHSGMYGGAAPNPIFAIAEILCALKDRDGHIRIPGSTIESSAERDRDGSVVAPAVSGREVSDRRDEGARDHRRARIQHPGTHVVASDVRSAWHSRRLHWRGREDGDPCAGGRESEHAVGPGPAAGRSVEADG
jgi:acetylornithine deacetylase/succinyl-diaminopimelate desuccinylase-like protein